MWKIIFISPIIKEDPLTKDIPIYHDYICNNYTIIMPKSHLLFGSASSINIKSKPRSTFQALLQAILDMDMERYELSLLGAGGNSRRSSQATLDPNEWKVGSSVWYTLMYLVIEESCSASHLPMPPPPTAAAAAAAADTAWLIDHMI